MINNKDITIIYPPVIDYEFLYQRPQQLCKAFAELGADVIYLNKDDYKKQLTEMYYPFAELNLRVVHQHSWKKYYRKRPNTVTILWMNYGMNLPWIKMINPDIVVYDSLDKTVDEFSQWAQYVPEMEDKSHIVFATADDMYEDHKQRNDNVHLLPNGADFMHFSKAAVPLAERPKNFPSTSGQTVGYYGAMAQWMDLGFLHNIAREFQLVTIGKNEWFNYAFEEKNITHLDAVDYFNLPYYLSWFDVCIVPFRLTNMIQGCNPIKFYEYISAGKPVVHTDMKELKQFNDISYSTDNLNALNTIHQAINENSTIKIHKRMEVAKQNSWRARAEYALNEIKKLL